jgi:hypothetical protein
VRIKPRSNVFPKSESWALAQQGVAQVVGNIGMYYAAYRLSQRGWNVQTPEAIPLIEKIRAERKKRAEAMAKRTLLRRPKKLAKRYV